MGEQYSSDYFTSRRAATKRAAEIIVPLLRSVYPAQSVLDIGCADGTWLSVFRSHGVTEIKGVDGP